MNFLSAAPEKKGAIRKAKILSRDILGLQDKHVNREYLCLKAT